MTFLCEEKSNFLIYSDEKEQNWVKNYKFDSFNLSIYKTILFWTNFALGP